MSSSAPDSEGPGSAPHVGGAAEGFTRLDDALARLGVPGGAPETHGMLCGRLAAGSGCGLAGALPGWVDDLLAHLGVEPPDAHGDRDTYDACVEAVRHCAAAAAAVLAGDGFGFQPLLPSDRNPIGRRTRALAQWCASFLTGLGLAGLSTAEMTGDVREAIGDLESISRVEPNPAADDESESAYTELVEYVRIAVLLIQEELAGAAGPHRDDPGDQAAR